MCARNLTRSVELAPILAALPQKRLICCKRGTLIFRKGEPADSVYYVQSGQVKISRSSESGREAIIGLLAQGDFLGEGCLIGQANRLADATCLAHSRVLRIDKEAVLGLLRTNSAFAEDFMTYLLSRNSRYQDDLEDQLKNSTEKRTARALLLLAHFGGNAECLKHIPYVSPETLAQLIGTTRARVSQLMSSFRRSGYIDYNRREITVYPSLLNVLIRDDPETYDHSRL